MQRWNKSFALRVAVPFVLFSLVWILVTDQLVARMVASAEGRLWWQTAKGTLFVLASTVLILALLARAERQEQASRRALLQQERLGAVGQMAAGVAHDFNNVMSVILLQSQILRVDNNISAEARERVELINRQAQQASTILQQMLDFSRLRELQRQPLDLVALLHEEVASIRESLPSNINVREEAAIEKVMVQGDAARLRQVLMNLAFNARDAMPDGGSLCFTLYPVAQNGLPPAGHLMHGEWVCLKVSDSGTGIAPEALENVFEPFFSTKKAGQGTGLGLSQVQGIVAQHGGTISVESQWQEGASFTIYLPVMVGAEKGLARQEEGL